MSEQQPRDLEREIAFAAWLVKLGAGCRQEVDDLMQETYTEALCYQIDPTTWQAFVRKSNACGRYQWFPKIHELLEDLHEFKGRQTPTNRMIPARTDDAWERNVAETQAERRANARKGLELIKAAYVEAMRQQPPSTPEPPKPSTTPEPTPIDEAKREERMRVLREQADAMKTTNGGITTDSVEV